MSKARELADSYTDGEVLSELSTKQDNLVANDPAVKTALNASGTAPIYGCRAWVNFDGTTGSGNTIRGSGNVSSVVRKATGYYAINFANNMPDNSYATAISHDRDGSFGGYAMGANITDRQVNFCDVCMQYNNGVGYNHHYIGLAVFR